MRVKDDRNNHKVVKSKDPCIGCYNSDEAQLKIDKAKRVNLFSKSKRLNYIDDVLKAKK
jgi:hypothetical protein